MVEFCCHDYYFRAIVNAVVDEYLSGDKEKQPSFEQRLFRWFKKKNKWISLKV